MDWYYILLICIVGVALILTAFAAFVYNAVFGSRRDKNPLLKYFTYEDFSLKVDEVAIPRKKGALKGYIYYPATEKNGKLIVFCHGMGPGQIAYTTEIAYFCNKGFTVLALDSTGCNLSEGKRTVGMYEGVRTAVAAIDFARSDSRLSDMPVYLVGHSWGGFSALCASAERKVNAVVAMSAPESLVKIMYKNASAQMPKFIAAILCPFLAVVDFFKFGNKANLNAPKLADKSGTPVLHVHGDNDPLVPLKSSAYFNSKGENAQKLLVEGRAHNPYNSLDAQKKMSELFAKLSKARKMSEEERDEYFNNFDFAAATEEDLEVMSKIEQFLTEN
ncbi:MAG: alpha/beta fold hydrolase [Clostridiales bacterium]|nr:alpha/beta fold hydrolase [Clostridiales bacterium]